MALDEWPMKWTCVCPKSHYKAKKCLTCGDRLPRWVEEGSITWDERSAMTKQEYFSWCRKQEEKDNEAILKAQFELIKLVESIEPLS